MAIRVPAQLKEIADQVLNGKERQETVRVLLSWFGAARRSYRNVRQIRKALNKTKLKTDPDFEEAWIDASVAFVLKSTPLSKPAEVEVATPPSPDIGSAEAIDGLAIPKKSIDDVS